MLEHARFKAAEVARQRAGRFVLAGDTLVALGDSILSKPADQTEAASMLRALAGQVHEVWTAMVLLAPDEQAHEQVDVARVRFSAVPEAELARYLKGTEWQDKAGAYGIQGWAGRWAKVEEGSIGTVMGFDPEKVSALLAKAGFRR